MKLSCIAMLLTVATVSLARADTPAVKSRRPAEHAKAIEFFERDIRPLFVEKCQSCHGGQKAKGNLRLTSRDLLLKGGDSGPVVVAGKPDESLLIEAVGYLGDFKMPPAGKLPEAEIAKLKRWVELGAPWPASASPGSETPSATKQEHGFHVKPKQRDWWAFQPVRDRTPPSDSALSKLDNDIDRFIRAELPAHGLQPTQPAERRTWLRRATFDLTGLPPTPDEIAAFEKDDSPQAYEKIVDRMLASPAYGERWARHWLDVVRYADYVDPNPKTRVPIFELTEAWRYRDWIVDSFNRDLPFDKFIVHQLAGDLLKNPAGGDLYPEGLVATTFLANGAYDFADSDKEKMVSDIVDDNIDTVGKTFLGLTLGCSRCHDHKFDPISNEDYYALAGIFYSSHFLRDLGPKGDNYIRLRMPLVSNAETMKRDQHLERIETLKAKLKKLDKLKPPIAKDHPLRTEITKELQTLEATVPPQYPVAMAMQEWGTPGGLFPNIQDVPIHIRGSYTRLGPVVPRRMPKFLAGDQQPPIKTGSGRRELAAWIANRDNPLTARVIVNRVWQWHFGEGIVRTPSNFGLLSEPPSHPVLLDWLASRFVQEGWSLKKLHRRIMLSETYKQSSVAPRGQIERDPDNLWLSRFAPRRLDAEAIRDALLTVTGTLDRTMHGPAQDDLTSHRRSLYVQTARWDRGSFAILFDAANPDSSVEKRSVSTVAPQSLFFMNHPFALDQAGKFAKRMLKDVPNDEKARLERAYQLLFSRAPSAEEVRIAQQVLGWDKNSETAWRDLAHVLLCSNEFVYVD